LNPADEEGLMSIMRYAGAAIGAALV